MGDSAYSFSLTTFSRTGKLLQIEYALNAVANGRTALGIAATDGVVIATDKKFGSSLVDASQVRKVEKITDGSGFVYAGVGPDYRVLGESFCLFVVVFLLVRCPCASGSCSSFHSSGGGNRTNDDFLSFVDRHADSFVPSSQFSFPRHCAQCERLARPPRPTSANIARRCP